MKTNISITHFTGRLVIKKNGIWLIALALVYGAFIFPIYAYSLDVFTENAPTANYKDENGLLKGHNVDLVLEIKRRLNEEFEIEMHPWSRAYSLLQQGPNVALFSTSRTVSRENLFKWVGPLSVAKFILYKMKDSNIKINSLEDAKKVKFIGCYKDDIRENILKENGFNNLSILYGHDADIRNIKMLMMRRIDLWVTSPAVLYNISKMSGINHSQFEEAFVIQKSYLYVAFSKQTPDEIIHEWQAALDDIKKDGTYQKIFLNYPMGNDFMTFDPPKSAKDS